MILGTELKTHQIAAVEKLRHLKVGALYMEMGTGKTRTALDLIALRVEAKKVERVLWLCPCSVKATIKNELQKHLVSGVELIEIHGIESLSSSLRLNCDLLEYVQKYQVFLVVDESNLVKNHQAKRTGNIERLASYCRYKLILNGTPISKCEKDLFAQWKILDWRILGYQSFWSFAANHLKYDSQIPGKINRVLNVDYLVRRIAPYTYQIKKSECINLPDKKFETWYFELTDSQKCEYYNVKEEFLLQLNELRPETLYRLFTALQHVVSGNTIISSYKKRIRTTSTFKDPEENPRVQALLNLVDRIGSEKIIIWCKYTSEIKALSSVLKKYYGDQAVVEFYGEIKSKNRQLAEIKFKNEANFFIANKTCAGYGLNLQFCNNVIYYSNDWDYATRSQSEDRVHRMGQDKTVWIYDICAENTIDYRILRCLWKKENLVDKFKNEIEQMKIKNLRSWIDGVEDLQ